MLDRERLASFFCEIARIDSISKREKNVAEKLVAELQTLGLSTLVDGAGAAIGGDTGNIIAKLPATLPGVPPLLVAAHMDTVTPGEGIEPIRDGDRIHSDGSTIVGADDKSGIAIIVEVLRALTQDRVPHGEIEVVFSIAEEIGLLGAKNLDYANIRSRTALVLDSSQSPGRLITKAPRATHFEFTVHGIEAHGGVCPERGISAIQIAALAITHMRLGRIDEETTANIGVIHGGRAANIVPNIVTIRGDTRSHNERKLSRQVRHMQKCLAAAAQKFGTAARIEESIRLSYPALNVPENAYVVGLTQQAARSLGWKLDIGSTGGGSDANILSQHGIEAVNMGTGMHEPHTVREYLDLNEAMQSAELLLKTIKLHAQQKQNRP